MFVKLLKILPLYRLNNFRIRWFDWTVLNCLGLYSYTSALGGGRNELLDGGGSQGERLIDEGAKLASSETFAILTD